MRDGVQVSDVLSCVASVWGEGGDTETERLLGGDVQIHTVWVAGESWRVKC